MKIHLLLVNKVERLGAGEREWRIGNGEKGYM